MTIPRSTGNRRTLEGILVAVIGILAIALAATILPSTQSTGVGLEGDGSEEAGEGGSLIVIEEPPAHSFTIEFHLLEEFVLILSGLALLVVLVYALINKKEIFAYLVAGSMSLTIVWLLLNFLSAVFDLFDFLSRDESGNRGIFGGDGNGGDRFIGTSDATQFPSIWLLIFGLLLLGTVLVIVKSADERPSPINGDNPDEGTVLDAAVSRVAGRAADRMEAGSDVENEVYRAWVDMTELLEVSSPETTTPREFELAAIDAGLSPEEVGELTRLFEDVRYGGYSANDEREQWAVRVFRRIETTYTNGDT